jgi:hypothetical protein
VNPATGTVGNSLVDNTYYDASGNVIETRPSGSEAFTKTVYDGIGRASNGLSVTPRVCLLPLLRRREAPPPM